MAKGKQAKIKGISNRTKKQIFILISFLVVALFIGIVCVLTQQKTGTIFEIILLQVKSFFETTIIPSLQQIGSANKVLQWGIVLLFGGISLYFFVRIFRSREFKLGSLYTSLVTLIYGVVFFLIVSGVSFSQTDMFYTYFAIAEVFVIIGVMFFFGKGFFTNIIGGFVAAIPFVLYQAFAIIPIWLILGFLVEYVENVELNNFFNLLLEFLTFLTPFVVQMLIALSLGSSKKTTTPSTASSYSSSIDSSLSNSYSKDDQYYSALNERMRINERHERMQKLNDITTFSNNPDEVDAARKELYDMGYYDNK